MDQQPTWSTLHPDHRVSTHSQSSLFTRDSYGRSSYRESRELYYFESYETYNGASSMERMRVTTISSPVSASSSFQYMPLTPEQRLSQYSLHGIKDERDNIQKKTFTKWVNKHLLKAGVKIDDLFVDLRDGNRLISLLEVLTGERLNRENGFTRFHKIQNVQYCLDFLKKRNIKLVNIRPEDIIEGNSKLTLGLIWTIILNFQVSIITKQQKVHEAAVRIVSGSQHHQVSDILHGSDATSARDALLQWARKATAGYPRVNVTNFSSSWRDGLAFNAILHRYRPNSIDWNKISDPSVSNRERLDNAFAAAEREFGVQRLLDAEDVDTNNPDEKSIITYVSTLYEALPHLPELSKDGLNDLISRLTRGIGITNEKLDIILQRIEDVERRVDTARPGEVERTVNEIVDELNALEHPIHGFFEDVEELKQNHHPDAQDFYSQVYGLQQRRTAYLDRLTNQLLVRLRLRTDNMLKENQARMESIRQSTFSRVEECIQWVRVRMEKLTEMEFLEDLETLEEMFEQHKLDNHDIQDFRQNVDECIARQAEVSPEDTYDYCDLLRVLESEYQQLRDLSAGRMLDLDSLIAFVRAAQMELVWVSEREEIEVTRNWSDIKQLDLPMLTNYYKQLLHEMELREKQYNDVHNQGAALLNQGHPAVHVIEVYLRTMQKQWDWLLSLAKCLEEHLRDALNLKSFMEEAADAEAWMEEQAHRLENNYNRTDFSLEEGERYLRELDEIKEILNKYHSVLMALTERCATISPLWQRGERITKPIVVTALCDYSDKDLHIKTGDDVTLLDNSDLIKWKIRDLSGIEGVVPSVVFRIPPPDTKLTAYLNRLLQQFEKLKKLWDKKHRMVRFNMVINTMKTIQGWDLDTFNAMDPEMRDAIMRALNDDANKLLSELDPDDPLALRLREELRRTNEHFWNLLNASQKPPEPDWASQFDAKINDLLRKLEESWRKLNDNVGKPVSRTTDELEKVIVDHKKFEDDLQALDGEVANVKELFRQLPNPTPTQRVNNDRLNGLWEDLWDLSRMYVERIKVLEAVLNGLLEVNDIVKQHEITLNSFDDLPAALDKLRGHHAQLLEMNMVLQQQQSVIDSLNRNAALLRQHVARTRINQSSHPDVDRLEEEVQQLNVRWENVRAQVVDRVKAAERATQIQSEYRPAYENEIAWLDRVEETINRLRRPEDLRPEEYQRELDMLAAEYAALQERTEAIENVNREGGKFIREAKGFDSRMGQFMDAVVGIHGPGIRTEFRRTKPQPKNGAQIVTEELEALNRRFAQLSSLILERRNNMQVLIQNWKRQKQDEAVQEASSRHQDISSMLSDLDHFKSSVFTECFSINLTPDSASQATNNIQNIKNSLDAWRDGVKMRLDEVDALCREQGDSLPPEHFSELREARHKLAANYDNVVRTVEGVYGRLNIITVLLLEFSTAASSTQSWITDCTRLVGDIKSKSADSNQFSKQYAASRQLLENVQDGESRLKEISTIVRKLEQEIGLLYDESPMGTPRTLNTDEVTTTFSRVQSDYEILLKMCQELLQFQNRLSVLDGDVLDKSRALDEGLVNVENNLSDFDQSKGIGPQSKMKTVENLQGKAREIDDKLDQFEQATLRLLSHLEGSGAPEEIRDLKQADVAKAKRRHSSLVDQLQDRKNKVNIELAENEGVKDAIKTLGQWAREFEKKVSQPVALPLNEQSLQELKKETQANQSELEANQGVLEQLKKAAERLPEGAPDLTEAKSKMARGSVQLKGLRDNINDALAGEQSFSLGCESLARSCDILSNNLKNTAPRDTQRLLDCEEDLATLAGSLESLEATAALLKSLPNTVGTEKLDQRIGEYCKRVAGLSRDLAAKRAKNSEAAGLEKQIQGLRQEAQEWLGLFDGELLELGPVSVNLEKLQDQRRQAQELQEKHREGLGLMEELEGALAQLGESEGSAGSRNSSVPRHLIDLMTRLNGQSDLLRNRLSKIGDNEIKALDLDETKKDVESWIDGQSQSLEALPTPSTKDELQTITSQIDKIEKGARQERRKVEDVHLKSRELARRASLPSESDQILKEDEKLENKWNEMQDQIEARLDRNRKVAQLLDGATQLEKWLGTKEKMILAIGVPSTEPAVSRSQIAQLQIIKGEADGEKPTLESLLENAEALARTDPNAGSLLDRVRILERRWKSLDEGMLSKEEAIKVTDSLSQEMKKLQKEIKGRLGEIESSLDNTTHLFPGDIEKQLNSLEDLRIQHKDLGDYVKELEEKLKSTEELEIDPANRDELEEQVQKTKRRVNDLGQKIDGTKTAVLTALNEGAAVDEQLNALLGVVRSAAADIQQFPPIVADPAKLAEQLTAVNTLHNGLLTKEAEVPVVKALVAKQLKKKHDPELKAKCDELSKAWGPLLVATLDRKSAVEKADDLIKHFNDSEKSLSHRLKEDEKEIEAVAAEAGQDSTVLQTLQAVDNILARRSADAEALIGLVDRIEQVAPGPDANKLKRKAENLLDDCKTLSRKAKNVAGESKKRADIKARIERLLSESRDFAGSHESLLKNPENINKERIGPQIAEISDFWNRMKRNLSNCLDEAKEAKIDVSPLEEELPQLDDRFSAILAHLSNLAQSFSDKQNAAQKILDLVSGVVREVDDLNNEINDLDSTAHCKEELEKQKQQCLAIGGQLEEEKEKVKGAMTETERALEDGVVGRLQHDSAKNSLENADKILSRCQKKIEQREKKLEQTAAEVEQFEAESKALAGELDQLMAALTAPIEVADLKKQSAELKQLKDSVKPLADRVDSFSSECKVLIKAAGPEAKTTELDEALQRVTGAWNKVASALAEREMKVDSAAQELGRYEDAYRNLLNWLEETEEGLENIGKPSSDAKAAKLQLGTYNLLLKHIEDKEASVAGFNALIGKLVDLATTESEKSGLRDKANGITKRYDALLGEAQDRQGKVIEAIDLAERLGEIMTPLSIWIAKTEKRVQALSSIATASSKMEEQLAAQAELEQEVDQKGDDLSAMDQLVPLLANLVSVKDAEELETQANNLGNSYDSLANRVHAIRELLADVATQVGDFEHDTNALASWLDEMEESLLHVDELAIEPDDLLEQSNILTDLAQAVTERDALVSNVVSVGKVLCKQTTTDEAIALQNRIEVLKNRYVDIMAVADEKLAHLSKAIPLSERFHDGFEAVIQWVEAVEEDLQNIDEADITTQAQLIFTLEEDVQNWRPEVEDLVGVSNQLQALSSRDKAEELYQNTTEMNRRVNQIADKVSRRAERLDVTEKQSRAVLDDLEFIVEWLTDARERLLTADPPSIDPEFLNRQLKNQRIMNEDVTLNKGKLRDVISEAKKIARQIGIDSPDSAATAALNEKCELGKDLVDEVSNLCMERTEHLERAKVLTEQLTLEFEELSQWLDNLEDELRSAPDVNTTTPQAELQKMNLHNSELMAAVIAYQPIVNTFDKDVKAMIEVCHEKEGEKLRELADELLDRYKEIGEAIRSRGQGIDSVMDTTSVFEERLSKLVENLEGAADKLRETGGVSADPVILETKLAENSAILENLQNKKVAYNHLREDAAGLLASAPEGDVAAQDVISKLNRLEKLWGDIEQEAALRGDFLSDVLGKAKHFWNELDDCQRAVDDLRYRLESVEPATGQPQQLQAQQAELASVANEINVTGPRIVALKQAGDALSSVIPPEEQDVVRTQVEAVQNGWGTITTLFADKNRDLIQAMEDAMTFHGDLNDLLGWLDQAEHTLALMPPAESLKIDEIPSALEELRHFKDDVDQHGILKEQLAQTAANLAEGASAAQAAVVRQPISELNVRWAKLYGAMADREYKVEMALLQMGKLSEAAGQLMDWINRSRATVADLATNTTPRNLRNVEIQICKLAVLKNDVDAHRPSVDTLNAAAKRLLKDGGDSVAAGKIDEMNQKWAQLNQDIEEIGRRMDQAKTEAESVGGELERWLSWLDDVEQQLATTKPTGGLPETAQTQMDDFRVLRAEVEQSAPALEGYLKETGIYLLEHGNDQESWIGRSHGQMKSKWNKVKELCADREKKLQLALEEAIALDESMRDTADWLASADQSLTQLEPVSHILEKAEKQNEDLEAWKGEVTKRKQLMAEEQAAGRRLQVYCEKKDAIPIKNGLITLKHRFEKVVARTNERGKLLAVAMDEARTWLTGVEQVEDCLFQVEEALASDAPSTSNVDRLKEHMNEIKELQKQMAETQPYYEMTKKRGSLLAERSTKLEAKQINARNNEIASRWAALTKRCVERQRAAEQAVLEGGVFDEAMKELEGWIDKEIARKDLPEYKKVHGDVDTVKELRNEENQRAAERLAKKKGVNTLLKKAEDMMAKGVDEAEAVGKDAERLREKWGAVEEAASEKDRTLSQAEDEAAKFDAQAHGLLEWLAKIEQKLKEPVQDLPLALAQVNAIKKELDAERPKKDDCLAKGQELTAKCHPKAEQALKHWMRVIDGRWKEVEERCAEKEFTVLEDEQKEAERDTSLKELHDFIIKKRDELARMSSNPMANDLEALEKLEKEYESLDFDLRDKQGDVDNAVKSARKGVNDPRGNQLQSEWKKLWLEALGYQQVLENQRALLEEMKRLEGWKWEQWKDRYVEWNDHGKARVSDLFRRIDRTHTGNVPRNTFIDAIIASKFPTSRLEMDKVADLFDKGDGMINSKEFIDALRFPANRAKPVTDGEKINYEIEKQRSSCSCCNKYRIEKISDNHYKFGDTEIKRMVRILRSTVMVRVGGGWEPLDVFLGKHDPCRINKRLNVQIYKELAPAHAIDTIAAFTKNRHARGSLGATPGPITKVREKTERSIPMSSLRHERAPSDLSSTESRIPRPSFHNSKSSLAESSRPPSRAGSECSESNFQSRIPSLRAKKGSRYVPPK